MSDPTRAVSLEGSFNFRDLGGYRTADGQTVAWRRVFRADGPHALTDDDRRVLGELDIRTVVDLRTAQESERGRWTEHVGAVTEHHLPLIDVLPGESEATAWSDTEHIARHYRSLMGNAGPSIASALEIVASEDNAVMYHCSAGKDRTGVLSAVLLGILGVDDEQIVADYALSAAAMERYFVWLLANAADKERLEQYRSVILSAAPQTMARLLEMVHTDYGSFTDYATTIGAAATIPQLKARLLNPPS